MTQIVRLERFGHDVYATWGRLYIWGDIFFTVERPWAHNRPNESCIPTGMYHLKRHDSEAHPASWAIIGDSVSLYEFENMPRFGCLIHPANFALEVEGCIAVGNSIANIGGVVGVTSSTSTLARIDAMLLQIENPLLEITSNR